MFRCCSVSCLFIILFFFIFNDSFQIDCLNICWNDLGQICRFGRTMAVHDQPEISFSIP